MRADKLTELSRFKLKFECTQFSPVQPQPVWPWWQFKIQFIYKVSLLPKWRNNTSIITMDNSIYYLLNQKPKETDDVLWTYNSCDDARKSLFKQRLSNKWGCKLQNYDKAAMVCDRLLCIFLLGCRFYIMDRKSSLFYWCFDICNCIFLNTS